MLGLAAIHSPLTSLIKSDLSGLTFINSIPEFADSIIHSNKNKKYKFIHPSIEDGVKGIKFIFAAKKSSNQNSKWIKI